MLRFTAIENTTYGGLFSEFGFVAVFGDGNKVGIDGNVSVGYKGELRFQLNRVSSFTFKRISAIRSASSREDFIKLMNRSGYKVLWTQERKHITFTCPNGMKCRCNKLHDYKYLKENI